MSYIVFLKELTNFDTQTTPKGVFNTAACRPLSERQYNNINN